MTVFCKDQNQATAEVLEFGATALGKSFPNAWGNQCAAFSAAVAVALFQRPAHETLGWGNAIDHIDNASTKYFDKIWNNPRDPNQLPEAGWITCYRGLPMTQWDGQEFGHTGLTWEIHPASQTQIQQDGGAAPVVRYPDGYYYSAKPAHKATFFYIGDPGVGDIRGWLRPKWQKVVYTGADQRGYGITSKVTAQTVAKKAIVREMDGVDVSNWQYSKRTAGGQPALDATKIPGGFVGVLITDHQGYASSGRFFRNPDADTALAQAKKSGKKLLVYHFARPAESDSDTQAQDFVKSCRSWLDAGAVPMLDWETDGFQGYAQWAIDWIKAVEKATGRQCVVYQRLDFAKDPSWGSFRRPMTLSWYGSQETMHGYADDFSGMPDVPGWTVAIWQYSEKGYLPGYRGYLDLNHYFGGIPSWDTAITSTTNDDLLEDLLTMDQATFDREKKRAGSPAWYLANGRDHSWRARGEIAGIPQTLLEAKVKRPDGSTVALKDVIAWDRANWNTDRENEVKISKKIDALESKIEALTRLVEGITK